MNKNRRTKIADVITQLDSAMDVIDNIRDDEYYALENMPENFNGSHMCSKMEECVDCLDDAIHCVISAIEYLRESVA